MHWIVDKSQTLLDALAQMAPDSSKTTLRSWLAEGRILVNGVQTKDPRVVVHPAMLIELEKKNQHLYGGLEILYQDEYLVVVYKPAGLLSVPTDTGEESSVYNELKLHFKRRTLYPVHRLDREVSGLLVFAFSEKAEERLKNQFEEHSILREYTAIAEGVVEPNKGTWQSYLAEDGVYYVRSVKDPSLGKIATTHYEVQQIGEGVSLLKVTLETGRKNQIRVHASEAGFPLLGDKKYGSNRFFYGRIALQACKLGFIHPFLEKPLLFERKLDEVFVSYPHLRK